MPSASFAHEAVTVDATAGGVRLTAGTYAPSKVVVADQAVLSLETAQIRWSVDGTPPTTTVGHVLEAGDVLTIDGIADIRRFRAIRTGGSSGTLMVSYSQEQG